MKIFLFAFLFVNSIVLCQEPSGGGYYKQQHSASIRSQIEYHINYSDSIGSDTSFFHKMEFDKKGFLIKEYFTSIYDTQCYYEYRYNKCQQLISVDTNGSFGYGTSIGPTDTLHHSITMTYETFDTVKRVINEVITMPAYRQRTERDYEYDSTGRLIKIKTYRLDKIRNTTSTTYIEFFYNEDDLLIEERVYGTRFNNNTSNRQLKFKKYFIYEKW